MITVGNIYGHGFDAAEVSQMERLGFAIRPQVSHYAGSQVMRFIDFERGPPLELIEVASEKEYREFVPKGMVPYSPGINLVLPEGSEKTLADFQEEFEGLRPYHLHVNYDGTSDPGKPGWNYINFEAPVIPGVFVWLTQLDKPHPVPKRSVRHANGATGIVGLWFDVEEENLNGLSRLVGQGLVHGTLRIGGLTFWTKGAVRDGPVIRGKQFPLRAAVLETNRLDFGESAGDDMARASFLSHPAVHVRTGPLSWDLVMTAAGAEHGTGGT
jgi:hypothetical protein